MFFLWNTKSTVQKILSTAKFFRRGEKYYFGIESKWWNLWRVLVNKYLNCEKYEKCEKCEKCEKYWKIFSKTMRCKLTKLKLNLAAAFLSLQKLLIKPLWRRIHFVACEIAHGPLDCRLNVNAWPWQF